MGFNIIWLTPDRFDLKPNKSPWLEMSKALSRKYHKVTVLTSRSDPAYNFSEEGVNLAFVKSLDLPFIFRISVLINMFFWILRNSSPENIVILNQDSLLLFPFLKLIGLKKIHLDIRTIPVEIHSIKDRLDRLLYWKIPLRLFGLSPSSYSFITNSLKAQIEKEFGWHIADYTIWQSGVNTEMFFPGIQKEEGRNLKIRLFYHGSISLNRGVDLVIKAMKEVAETHKDVEFVIVGGGSVLVDLKKLTSDLDLEDVVIFKGFLPYENMASEIAKADICICPLTDRLEWHVSSPIKVFEYMACGKPMILTPILAHKDVAGGFPFVVWAEGYQPEDFAKAIDIAISELSTLKESAKDAAEIIKTQYEWRHQAEKLELHLLKHYGAS